MIILAFVQEICGQTILYNTDVHALNSESSHYDYKKHRPFSFTINKQQMQHRDYLSICDKTGDGVYLWLGEQNEGKSSVEYYITSFGQVDQAINKYNEWRGKTTKIDFSFKKYIPVALMTSSQVKPLGPNLCFGFNFIFIEPTGQTYLEITNKNHSSCVAYKNSKRYSIILNYNDVIELNKAIKGYRQLQSKEESKMKMLNNIFK